MNFEDMFSNQVNFTADRAAKMPPGSSFVAILSRKQFYEGLETFKELLPDGCHLIVVYEYDHLIAVKIVRWNFLIKVLKDSTIDVIYIV